MGGEDDPAMQRTSFGLSGLLVGGHQQTLFFVTFSPSHRHQNHMGVSFTGIFSCWNIALIPLLSVRAHFSSLWSLNNFAQLFSSSLYLHFFVASSVTITAWVPAWLQPVCDGLSLSSNGSYTHAAEGLPPTPPPPPVTRIIWEISL